MNGGLRLVHLSDIHFSRRHDEGPHDLDADVRDQLRLDLVRLRENLGEMHGILVTGDIAFSGQAAEYQTAARWLEQLCSDIDLGSEQVWVVPGNHDVDRHVVRSSRLLQVTHTRLRECPHSELSGELRALLRDDDAAGDLLFTPMSAYNEFAAAYQCTTTPERPVWDYTLCLNDGSELVLWGLNSALISDQEDRRGNLILGEMQVAGMRERDDRVYITLCHHPPVWLRDHDTVQRALAARAHVQLFGHAHIYEPWTINDRVRIVAGAVHPERELDWCPHYNVLELSVQSDADDDRRALRVVSHPRMWNLQSRRFVPGLTDDGSGLREVEVPLPDWSPPTDPSDEPGRMTGELADEEDVAMVETTEREPQDVLRRATYLLLRLPRHRQRQVLRDLSLFDEDGPQDSLAAIQQSLERAQESGQVEVLLGRVEQLHEESQSTTVE